MEVPLLVTVTLGVEGLYEIEVSMDETSTVVTQSDDCESAEAFS